VVEDAGSADATIINRYSSAGQDVFSHRSGAIRKFPLRIYRRWAQLPERCPSRASGYLSSPRAGSWLLSRVAYVVTTCWPVACAWLRFERG